MKTDKNAVKRVPVEFIADASGHETANDGTVGKVCRWIAGEKAEICSILARVFISDKKAKAIDAKVAEVAGTVKAAADVVSAIAGEAKGEQVEQKKKEAAPQNKGGGKPQHNKGKKN